MDESEEFVWLVLFGLLGLLCCFVLIGLIFKIENAIKRRMKAMIENRKRRYCYLNSCRARQRLRTRGIEECYFPPSLENSERQRPPRVTRSLPPTRRLPPTTKRDLPSYEEAVKLGEEKDVNLPSYKEALARGTIASHPPVYSETQE
jgi:hypothetical protein